METMNIRKVVESDYDGIMRLIRAFYDESIKEYGSQFNPDYLIDLFPSLKDSSFVCVKPFSNEVVGLLAGKYIFDILDGRPTYAEIMWFMDKQYRKYGVKLLKFVENYLRKDNIRRMVMVHMGNTKPDKLMAFYERLGYTLCECHYIKNLDKY